MFDVRCPSPASKTLPPLLFVNKTIALCLLLIKSRAPSLFLLLMKRSGTLPSFAITIIFVDPNKASKHEQRQHGMVRGKVVWWVDFMSLFFKYLGPVFFSNREAVASGGGGVHSRRNLCDSTFAAMMLCLLSLKALTKEFEAMPVFARCMRGFLFFMATVIGTHMSWLSSVAPQKVVLARKNNGATRNFVRSEITWVRAQPPTPHTQAGGAPPAPTCRPTACKVSSQERALWGW